MIVPACAPMTDGAGSPAAPHFERFFSTYHDQVRRFLASLVHPDEVEDCVQETFLAALRTYRTLPPGIRLRSWIMTIAHRKAIDTYRSRSRRPMLTNELPDTSEQDAPTPDPTLWAIVKTLPPKQRTALVHRFVLDLPYRDIARAMGSSQEAARQSVHEAIKKLRARKPWEVWSEARAG